MNHTPEDRARHATARAQIAACNVLAKRHGYAMEYHPTTKVRGWPAPSAKPFALYLYGSSGIDGKHVASFATFEALERAFTARAGL